MADGIGLDLRDIRLAIAERAQRLRHRAVDDLPVAAAGKLLEFHQREIRLDAGGVAIHHEANGAGRRHHRGLRIAVAVQLAELQRLVPGGPGVLDDVGLLAGGVIERHRIDGQRLIAAGFAVRGAAVVADHPQHVRGVLLVAGEGAELLGHLGRRGVADAGHHGGQGAAQRAAFLGVIRQTHGHQQAADIGETQTQRAEFVRKLRDRLGRELRHHHGDFEHDRPQATKMLVSIHIEQLGRGVVERDQVGGGQIAGGIVQEHVFRARIGGADLAGRLASVPVVHGGVEVQAGIGGRPGGVADFLPEITGLQRLGDLLVGAADQVPVAIGLHRAQEIVLQRYRVVGVLARYREIGFRIPVGVVGRKIDFLVALAGELDDALDHAVGDHGAAREFDLAAQSRVLLGVEAVVAAAFAVDAGFQHRFQMPLVELGAGDEGGDLLLFLHLPVDIGLDIRVIGVDHHHLGGAARGAAGLDRTGSAVADLEEAHQAATSGRRRRDVRLRRAAARSWSRCRSRI